MLPGRRNFGLEVTPLAADGVLYVTGPNQVFALDALTGSPLWHYSRPASIGLVAHPGDDDRPLGGGFRFRVSGGQCRRGDAGQQGYPPQFCDRHYHPLFHFGTVRSPPAR